jgi:hypothetical protein
VFLVCSWCFCPPRTAKNRTTKPKTGLPVLGVLGVLAISYINNFLLLKFILIFRKIFLKIIKVRKYQEHLEHQEQTIKKPRI